MDESLFLQTGGGGLGGGVSASPHPPGQSRLLQMGCQACCCPGSGSPGRHGPFPAGLTPGSQACPLKPVQAGSLLPRPQLLGRGGDQEGGDYPSRAGCGGNGTRTGSATSSGRSGGISLRLPSQSQRLRCKTASKSGLSRGEREADGGTSHPRPAGFLTPCSPGSPKPVRSVPRKVPFPSGARSPCPQAWRETTTSIHRQRGLSAGFTGRPMVFGEDQRGARTRAGEKN